MSKYTHHKDWKLRIVVDANLSPGQQLAQSLHAAIEFTQEHPELTKHWHLNSNSVVCLATKDIEGFLARVKAKQITHSIFRESDLNYRLTAIALEATAISRKITANLPLSLKDPQ